MHEKVIGIVGGGQGIGKAVAYASLKRGYRAVRIADKSLADIRSTVDELSRIFDSEVSGDWLDVRDQSSVDRVVATWADRLPDVVVNTAGVREVASVQDTTEEAWRRTIGVNLSGAFNVLHCVANRWIAAGRGGVVINFASVGGEVGFSERAAYCASKAGIIGLTRAAALDLAPHGIRVLAVSPGFIETGMSRPEDEVFAQTMVPVGRRGERSEVAELVLDLSDATFMTGCSVVVDGGLIAGHRL